MIGEEHIRSEIRDVPPERVSRNADARVSRTNGLSPRGGAVFLCAWRTLLVHQTRKLHGLKAAASWQIGLLIGADDVQNAMRASNIVRSSQPEENRVRHAVRLSIEEMVASALAVSALVCLSADMVLDELRERD